jgi:hypothetical protein
MRRVPPILCASILAANTGAAAIGQSDSVWPERGLYYVETKLVFEELDSPLPTAIAAFGETILTRYARPISSVTLASDVVDEDGVARVGAGMALLESHRGGVPGVVYCGRTLQNAPMGVSSYGCLVDSDTDGSFDHLMESASATAPRGPLVAAAALPMPLNEPIEYEVSYDVTHYRFGFELFNADGTWPSPDNPQGIFIQMRHYEGEVRRSAEAMVIEVWPDEIGSTINLWGACLRYIEISDQQLKYEVLSVDNEVLSWPERSILDWDLATKCSN